MIYSAYHPTRMDFARVAYNSLKDGKLFEGIGDQVINPSFADDLVNAIGIILQNKAKGIYHVAASDFTTNHGFVEKISKAFLKLDYNKPDDKKLLDLHRTKGYLPAKDEQWKSLEDAALVTGLIHQN